MLGKVLKKSTCAECRFCCAFRRSSLWETPLFAPEVMERLNSGNSNGLGDGSDLTGDGGAHIAQVSSVGVARKLILERQVNGAACGQMNLEYKYKTDNQNEEAPCEFLDTKSGCVLSEEDKPFDCKIWPLRIMKKDGGLVIALTPTCPAINEVGEQAMRALVEDGLGTAIYEYALAHPFIIKDYKEGFPVLMEFDA